VGCYYCVLAEAGFFPVEWLETYQHANSHPVTRFARKRRASS
jgi:transketolase N-terminal domain/subunit